MQKNLVADIQELMSRPNYKWSTMNISVNTAVSGANPFTYKGANGSNNKTILAAFPLAPDSGWIINTSLRRNGDLDMIDVWANGAGTIPVRYLYIDR